MRCIIMVSFLCGVIFFPLQSSQPTRQQDVSGDALIAQVRRVRAELKKITHNFQPFSKEYLSTVPNQCKLIHEQLKTLEHIEIEWMQTEQNAPTRTAFFSKNTHELLSRPHPGEAPVLIAATAVCIADGMKAADILPVINFAANPTGTHILLELVRQMHLNDDRLCDLDKKKKKSMRRVCKLLVATGISSHYTQYKNSYDLFHMRLLRPQVDFICRPFTPEIMHVAGHAVTSNNTFLVQEILNREGPDAIKNVEIEEYYGKFTPLSYALDEAFDSSYGFGMMNLLLRSGNCVNQPSPHGALILPEFFRNINVHYHGNMRKKHLIEIGKILAAKPSAQHLRQALEIYPTSKGQPCHWHTARNLIEGALVKKEQEMERFLRLVLGAATPAKKKGSREPQPPYKNMDISLATQIATFIVGTTLHVEKKDDKNDEHCNKRQKLAHSDTIIDTAQ